MEKIGNNSGKGIGLGLSTLGPAYNEYGYYEHPATMSRFLCTNFLPLTAMVKKFGYYEQICLLSHLQHLQ